MGLRKLLSRTSPPERDVRASNDAPAAAPIASEPPRDRRLVSGERVLCRCSLDLPRHDPFSPYRERCAGYIVMNVRGGSLYLPVPLGEREIAQIFPSGGAAPVKRFTLYPDEGEPILVGDLRARYLKTREGRRLRGHVLRFVGLDETQLELLNGLPSRFPLVSGDEESAIPFTDATPTLTRF